MSNKQLCVSTDGTAGPYIMVAIDQLAELRRLLDEHGIRHSVEEEAISLDGAPETVIVDLESIADARAVQAVLDDIR